jgi:hypothetical protein
VTGALLAGWMAVRAKLARDADYQIFYEHGSLGLTINRLPW